MTKQDHAALTEIAHKLSEIANRSEWQFAPLLQAYSLIVTTQTTKVCGSCDHPVEWHDAGRCYAMKGTGFGRSFCDCSVAA